MPPSETEKRNLGSEASLWRTACSKSIQSRSSSRDGSRRGTARKSPFDTARASRKTSPCSLATTYRCSGVVRMRRPSLVSRSEEHTSELQSRENLVCRLLLEKQNGRAARERL